MRLTFDITGTGTGPALTATPSPVVFAPTRVTTGAINTQVLTLKNTGEDALTITAIAPVLGTEFSVMTGPTLPITIAAGSDTTATLAFAPSASGTQTDTLDVTSDAVGAAITPVPLTGVGTNAVIAVTDAAFGTVLDAGSGSNQSITISNTGALPVGTLDVTQAALADTSGWFSFASSTGCAGQTTCALALAIGTTAKTLAVTCHPTPSTASGSQTATVTFTSDSDPGGDNVSTLTCTAGRPTIVLGAPAPNLEFGNVGVGSSSTISFSVHNGGTSALTYSIAEAGASYVVTSGACAPCTIAAGGADKTITVKFTPTALGDTTGSLTLTTNDPDPGNGSITISLDGTGAASQISGAPGTLAFGNVDVGKSSALVLTVSDTGNATLNISGAALTGAANLHGHGRLARRAGGRARHDHDVDDQVRADRDRREDRHVHDLERLAREPERGGRADLRRLARDARGRADAVRLRQRAPGRHEAADVHDHERRQRAGLRHHRGARGRHARLHDRHAAAGRDRGWRQRLDGRVVHADQRGRWRRGFDRDRRRVGHRAADAGVDHARAHRRGRRGGLRCLDHDAVDRRRAVGR